MCVMDLSDKILWLLDQGEVVGCGYNNTGKLHSLWTSYGNGWTVTGYGIKQDEVYEDLYESVKDVLYMRCSQYEYDHR